MTSTELGKSRHGIPDVVMQYIDQYVDSLGPEIQPRIAAELDVFQQKTIDSLEEQVVDAFRSLFNRDKSHYRESSRGLDDSPPDIYGGQSLPFAVEIANLTRSFSKVAEDAENDLQGIFDITEGREDDVQDRGLHRSDSVSRGAKGFLSAAINAFEDHLEGGKGRGGQKFELDGLLGVLTNTVKEAAHNPDEKARIISPEIKERVGAKLKEQHAPIADKFTRIALEHIKRWLRGNTSARDVGDGAKGEIEDQVKHLVKGIGGLLGHKKHSEGGTSRGLDDGVGEDGASNRGFSNIISGKLSKGLAEVHRGVRLEFRSLLGEIEKQLFELLPDEFQRPLEKILGGNPFGSQLDCDAEPHTDRDFGDDIKIRLVNKIRSLVRKMQETLRESILGVVNGGHRKFERTSWVFVQNIVEMKVQKYLPQVRIVVPDDIGNEGVSVGVPTVKFGDGQKPEPLAQGTYASPPPNLYGGQPAPSQMYNPAYQQPPREYRSDQHQEY